MADNAIAGDDELLKNVKTLLWGSTVKEDVFKRWAQGTEAPLCIATNAATRCRHMNLYVVSYWFNGRSSSRSIVIISTKNGKNRKKIHLLRFSPVVCENFRLIAVELIKLTPSKVGILLVYLLYNKYKA